MAVFSRRLTIPVAGALATVGLSLAILEWHHPNPAYSYRDGIEAVAVMSYIRGLGFSLDFPFVNQQMLGSFYGLNHWLSPSMWLVMAFGTGQPVLDASYALCAAELFLTTYLLARKIGAAIETAVLGGLLLPFFILPLAWQGDPFLLLTFCPIFGDLIVINNLILMGLADIFLSPRPRLLPFVLVAGAAGWFALLSPLATLLVIPVDAAAWLALSGLGRGQADFCRRQLFLALTLVLLLVLFGPLLLGLFVNTSASFFAPELRGDTFSNPWPQLPIIFKRWTYGAFALLSFALFWLAARWAKDQPLPRLLFPLAALFIGMLVIISGVFLFLAKGAITFPRPWYFEIMGWPFYFICWGFILDRGWRLLADRPAWPAGARSPYALFTAVVAAAALFAWHAPQRYMPQIMPYRPSVDRLTGYLLQRLNPRSEIFNGQVATFIAGEKNAGDTLAHDRAAALAAGNSHRGEMLRYFGLHTLDEYNSLISPAKYLLLTRFLAHRDDDQSRAMIVFSRPDQDMLAMLGVRLVVSDGMLPPPAQLRVSEDVPGVGTHRVYELPNPNLGTYAPTLAKQADTPRQQLRAILAPDFDFRHSVVSAERLPPLSPAQARFSAPPGGYRIDATSAGTALLVLPVAYSHCLAWIGQGPAPRLIRVDFALTGLLFHRAVHGAIQGRMSALSHPFCALADWREMRDLKSHYQDIWPTGA